MTTDRGPAPLTPTIRLTGQQLAESGAAIPEGYFLDWDEYEDFVPAATLDAERARSGRLEAAARAVVSEWFDGQGFIGDSIAALRAALGEADREG
jgi:hypothetical protein